MAASIDPHICTKLFMVCICRYVIQLLWLYFINMPCVLLQTSQKFSWISTTHKLFLVFAFWFCVFVKIQEANTSVCFHNKLLVSALHHCTFGVTATPNGEIKTSNASPPRRQGAQRQLKAAPPESWVLPVPRGKETQHQHPPTDSVYTVKLVTFKVVRLLVRVAVK